MTNPTQPAPTPDDDLPQPPPDVIWDSMLDWMDAQVRQDRERRAAEEAVNAA